MAPFYIVELRRSPRRKRFVGRDLDDVAYREKARQFQTREHAQSIADAFKHTRFTPVIVAADAAQEAA